MRRLHVLLAAVVASAVGVTPASWASDNGEPRRQVTHEDFRREDFSSRSTTIDNRWLPLVPGTQYVWEGTANRGEGTGAHRVVLTVTDVGKWVNGVHTLVLWDRDIQDGELVEEELAFHAQDDDGNVWGLGEYPEEHEDGKFVGAPSTWLAGEQRAQAGVMMRADPKEGTSSYFQGIAPEVDFKDEAKVAKEHQKTCVPTGCYHDVLVVDEWNPLNQPQDGHQFKFHAPGVGVVRVEARGGEEQETLVLVQRRRLHDKEMDDARDRVLTLDRRAYHVAPDVYGDSPPAERLG